MIPHDRNEPTFNMTFGDLRNSTVCTAIALFFWSVGGIGLGVLLSEYLEWMDKEGVFWGQKEKLILRLSIVCYAVGVISMCFETIGLADVLQKCGIKHPSPFIRLLHWCFRWSAPWEKN